MNYLLFYSAFLKLFFGIVAVGTEMGHTYLVDLRIDDEAEQFDEWNPSHIEFISEDNVAMQRIAAQERGSHLAIELGGKVILLN